MSIFVKNIHIMAHNLNLYISDENLLLKAKHYATQRRISMSKLIEHYLSALIQKPEVTFENIIKELAGSLPPGSEMKGRMDYVKHRAK